KRAGARVVAVDSAEEALSYVDLHRPHLVLTDIAMPGIDGYALHRQLRQRKELADVRVVALTAFPASAVAGDEKEFDRYFRKPIDPFELTEKLSQLVPPPVGERAS